MSNLINFCGERKQLLIKAALILIVLGLFAGAGWRLYHKGYNAGYQAGVIASTQTKGEDKSVTLPAKVKTETQTVVKYVPRPAGDTADVAADIGKQQLTVRVNGQEQTVKKSDSEKYVFDQNQLRLDQTSKATVDIKVPVVDKTRRWSAGIGYGNHGLAGKVDYPIGHVVGGWFAGDRKTVMAGISVNF